MSIIINTADPIPTPDEFLKDMQIVAESNYTEWKHRCMDDMMCDLLEQLGYGEAIEVFRRTGKWYS